MWLMLSSPITRAMAVQYIGAGTSIYAFRLPEKSVTTCHAGFLE